MNIPAKPSLAAIAVLLGALGLAACGTDVAAPQDMRPPLEGATIGGEFELVGSDGGTVRWSDFDGKYRTVYFGYAYCPDICPTDVQRATQGLSQFARSDPALAAKIQPIFITIDPERDTPEVVGEFANAFSEDLIGLTGTPEQIAEVAKTFAVAYQRLPDAPGGGYLMNHSTITYLFGPEGEPLATLPTDEGADAVAAELAKWVK